MKILPIAHATSPSDVGGKAANLARLIAIGAPVPDGFVLTCGALERFVAEQESGAGRVDAAVMAAWTKWRTRPVIVRSSAVGEDSNESSFAGQLDSVTGVADADGLRAAILQVWRSQWSDRVRAYQSARRTLLAGMGAIVQRQVDARLSGVLFTLSPTSSSQMLVEYCEGLGEGLVSGVVDPGRVAIERRDLSWKELAAADADCRGLLLDEGQMAALGHLALDIEEAFGSPQDIEWTIDGAGRIWVVQSRPITARPTLGPSDRRTVGPSDPPKIHWSNANVNENFPQPICPLLYSIARAGYYHYFRNLGRAFGIGADRLEAMDPALRQIIGVHGARMYYNLTSIHEILKSAPFGEHLAASFDQFVGVEDGRTERGVGWARKGWIHDAREMAVITASTSWQYLFLTSRIEEFERTADEFAARTHPSSLAARSTGALAADIRDFMDIRCNRWKNASLADAASMVCYGALQRLLARAFPSDDQQALHNTLLKALPDLASSRPPVEMWKLSRMIRSNLPLRDLLASSSARVVLERLHENGEFSEFRRELETFIEQWGFRCSAELMLTSPSFQEDPAPLIDLLNAYASMDGESPAEQLERQAAERLRDTSRVLEALRRQPVSRWLPFISLSPIVGTILKWTQRAIQLRERARLKQALLYSRLRRVALALGGQLATRGRLSQAEDIFFLTVDEVDLLATGGEMFPDHAAELVALRRRAHAQLAETTPPDSMRLEAGEYLKVAAEAGSAAPCALLGRLTGVGACGGSSTARAAVLLDVTESHRLTPGSILVTRQTDPGWGPIFPLISGLVIERGGMLSHGAIIAREFGIPSVVGVRNATRLIPHGGSITVDGDRGLVQLLAGGAG